jgi:hypothetical protein
MSNAKYLETFQTLVSAIEQYGGAIRHDPGTIKTELSEMNLTPENATEEQIEITTKLVKDKYLAMTMITAAYKSRYTKVCEELENDVTKGTINWPVTVTEAYNLLVNYTQTRPSGNIFNDSEGVAFTTVEKTRAPQPDRAIIKCFACNKMGHYSKEFPEKEKEGEVNMVATMVMDVPTMP